MLYLIRTAKKLQLVLTDLPMCCPIVSQSGASWFCSRQVDYNIYLAECLKDSYLIGSTVKDEIDVLV